MSLYKTGHTLLAETVRMIGETMRRWIYMGTVVFSIVLAACSGDKPKELLETAEFEERQHNVAHAKQLYDDLIRLYPDSKPAETARARLAVLNHVP
jgi:outer membrane protein assembly factor BamD (BamD/ComL family)